jgi:hypothetical protein
MKLVTEQCGSANAPPARRKPRRTGQPRVKISADKRASEGSANPNSWLQYLGVTLTDVWAIQLCQQDASGGPEIGPIQSFLRRHKNLFAIVGATTIFVTFVVNEAYRDYYKDMVGAFQGVENNAFIWRQTDAQFPASPDTVGLSTTDTMKRLVEAAEKQEEHDRVGLVMIEESLMDLPLVPVIRDEISDMRMKLRALRHDTLVGHRTMTPEAMSSEMISVHSDMGHLYLHVLLYARELHKEASERYAFYRHLSWALYGLGWSLALLGKVWGLGELGLGEE